ncbi:hypothetical protein NQ317_006106 [Molorchus minor]|uniref:Uncharacterized protein n=1 Tax=Molorchus minor TaxID=1323400 RepID=A0ABQ9IQW0_9CUCU|nr:hypothetical protein NQ317_006106 [Molorchus minor]
MIFGKKGNHLPEDWNKPLPEYLQKEYENSYLNVKSKELRVSICHDGPVQWFCLYSGFTSDYIGVLIDTDVSDSFLHSL